MHVSVPTPTCGYAHSHPHDSPDRFGATQFTRFAFSGGSGSPALVTKGDAKIAEVAARTNDCKTLRGALSLLEAQMA